MTEATTLTIRLHAADNVVVARADILPGTQVPAEGVSALDHIPDGPGFDPCALTGQVASGANMICFTTGRGSVYGCKPVPSLKLATNSAMYRRMDEDMDIDCGVVLDEGVTVAELGARIFERILEVASGDKTKSEALGFGDDEFVPWQIGAVM